MVPVTIIAKNAATRYFDTLAVLGYKSYEDVNKLIVLLYLEEFLQIFNTLLTDDEVAAITKCLYCLYGNSCLIDMPSYYAVDELSYINNYEDDLRIAINNIQRMSEKDSFRKEQ